MRTMIGALGAAALVLAVPGSSAAIIMRHDTPASAYLASASDFPALVDMPGEGHGVLIAEQWVVTVAHNVGRHPEEVVIAGRPRRTAEVIVHPGYRPLPPVPGHGDVAPFMEILASSDDIALIRLAEPVTDVAPVPLYRAPDEQGRLVKLYGKGATGDGLNGQDPNSPRRTSLRRAYNHVSSTDGRWLTLTFDAGSEGHELEGATGSGDSGGPVLIQTDGAWVLAGMAAWQWATGDIRDFRPGLYGQVTYQVRLSHYAAWIDGVIGQTSGVAGACANPTA